VGSRFAIWSRRHGGHQRVRSGQLRPHERFSQLARIIIPGRFSRMGIASIHVEAFGPIGFIDKIRSHRKGQKESHHASHSPGYDNQAGGTGAGCSVSGNDFQGLRAVMAHSRRRW